jgi:hypothetical protein
MKGAQAMAVEQKHPFPTWEVVRRCIGDTYPMTRDEIVSTATECDAPEETLWLLQRLPQERYKSAAELERDVRVLTSGPVVEQQNGWGWMVVAWALIGLFMLLIAGHLVTRNAA